MTVEKLWCCNGLLLVSPELENAAPFLPSWDLALLTFRFIRVNVVPIIITPTAMEVLENMKEYVEKPTFRYMLGKLKDINQIITIVKAILLLVTLLRYVYGFLTARYLSIAKLVRLRSEAVQEMK
jgi:hypothetical protein